MPIGTILYRSRNAVNQKLILIYVDSTMRELYNDWYLCYTLQRALFEENSFSFFIVKIEKWTPPYIFDGNHFHHLSSGSLGL